MMNWLDKARCKGMDTDLFMPDENGQIGLKQLREAVAICQQCTVRLDCLNWAIETNEIVGIYGGMSRNGRLVEHRKRKALRKVS